jgi:hypothetical protein
MTLEKLVILGGTIVLCVLLISVSSCEIQTVKVKKELVVECIKIGKSVETSLGSGSEFKCTD